MSRSSNLLRLREAAVPLSFAAAAAAGLLSLGASAQAATVSGNAAITTDYVWRGSSQTRGDAAVQAGFKVAGGNGLYASVWGSNVEFAPDADANRELDLTVGWGRSLGKDWAMDVNVLHYRYPSTTADLNWTELNGTVTFRDDYWASIGYSDEALGYGADGVYASAGARFPLSERFRLEAVMAHYVLDDAVVAVDGYSHGWLSAIWAFEGPFEARLTAHATDSNAEAIFGDVAGSRIEAALQASF